MLTARERAIVAAVDKALAETLDLRRAETLADFVGGAAGPRYFPQPRLRVAHHFDISPEFLVLDPVLGSLGFVELALPSNPADRKEVARLVSRHIDTASYARHLLLRDRKLAGRKALNVELVLLTADETTADRQGLDAIGEALRRTIREADSLSHIGVSVLCYAGAGQAVDGRLRRAFPWLLKATRDWLASPHAARVNDGPPPELRHLRRVRLTNYRLPGTRDLTLVEARVHLIHGPNGSGKSSFVEALELVSRDRIERLERAGTPDYSEVIRNRATTAPATIALGWSPDSSRLDEPREVQKVGIERYLCEDLDAGSFRLDQALMDSLIGQVSHERARRFLYAFFPEAKWRLKDYERAAEDRRTKLEGLKGVVTALTSAREALMDLEGWRGAVTPTRAGRWQLPRLLNQWLEATAALDLIRRERSVRETIQRATKDGWTAQDAQVADLTDLLRGRPVRELDDCEGPIAAEANRLQAVLDALTSTPTTAGPGESTTIRVNQGQARSLNAVSRWLFSGDDLKSHGLFGDKLARVINAGDAPTYATLVVGGDKWASPAIAQLDALIGACRAAEGDQLPPIWPGHAEPSEYDKAAKAQKALVEAGAALSESFTARLRSDSGASGEFDGSLIAAVNELMALFTPARWSYDDIRLPSTIEDGKLDVGMELGTDARPARAELHLNTAELNLFTVALFMLCAGRVPKPLGLLVFDDPLQNMDELTSIALARGLARVVRLWAARGRDDEVLILFHGEDDLQRFRAEIPAATYRLPWLSPGPSSETIEIPAESAGHDVQSVQSIEGMLQLTV